MGKISRRTAAKLLGGLFAFVPAAKTLLLADAAKADPTKPCTDVYCVTTGQQYCVANCDPTKPGILYNELVCADRNTDAICYYEYARNGNC